MGQRSDVYMQRLAIFPPDTRHQSRWVVNQLRSHERPITPAPGLLGRDRPDKRCLTKTLKETPGLFEPGCRPSAYPDAQCPPEDPCSTGCS